MSALLIDRITTERVRLAPSRPVASAGAQVAALDYLLVHLSAGGFTGLGYACIYTGQGADALHVLIESLTDLVRGEDAHLRGRIWDRLWNATASIGHDGLATAALCAYDLALWDLAGKAAALPVYQLIGAVRDRLPLYYSGLFLNLTVDELVAEAQQARAQGFRAVKMRVGKPAEVEDLQRILAVREALGDGIQLMVDCSRAFDASRAIRLGRRLEALELRWIEEPTPPEDLAGSAQVAAALDTTVATGENAYTKYDVRRLLEQQAGDLIMLDLQRMGGLTEWLKAAALCEAYSVPVSNHLFLEATAHALCSCRGEGMAEYIAWPTPFQTTAQIVQGDLVMGATPGLGFSREEGLHTVAAGRKDG